MTTRQRITGPAPPTTTTSASTERVRRTWTPDQVRALGVMTDFETAADVLGIGKSLAYQLVRLGQFPVRRIKLGRRVAVRVVDILTFLGVE